MIRHPLFRLLCVMFVIGAPALAAILALSAGLITEAQFLELFR